MSGVEAEAPQREAGLLVLSQRDVDALLFGSADGAPQSTRIAPEEILNSQREVFRAVSAEGSRAPGEQGQHGTEESLKAYENPQRLSVGMRRYGGLFMPARLGDTTTCKIVSVPRAVPLRISKTTAAPFSPSSQSVPAGLPGSTLLLDSETGAVRAIVNATSLTALRTAAGSMLATVRFKPPREAGGPLHALVFGLGNQAFFHAWFLLHLYGHGQGGGRLRSLTLVNTARRRAEWSSQAKDTEARLRADVDALNNRSRADDAQISLEATDDEDVMYARLKEADIVCCCTPAFAPLFDSGVRPDVERSAWKIKPSAHFNLVGAYKPHMREVDAGLVRAAAAGAQGRVILDSREACAHEAGDVLQAGVDVWDRVACKELGDLELELGNGNSQEARDAPGPSLFKSVGVGLQDVAVTKLFVDTACRVGAGTRVDF